ncbi:MAG: rRNA maturation RNase YbeY [Alphaproteobacteria bacterium]|nr:rRNA maturation RNase YbeY [Alphaproteobacteria bacterium]HCQ71413.1 rRNA maturation RNase YbeY [Rhodospirillaceae bacterium]|tara:strand:+ start:4922 stop:5371 length:450 start_codon:yes stop_codon:yes gene_type:complete
MTIPPVECDILCEDSNWPDINDNVTSIIRTTLGHIDYTHPCEVSIVLTNDEHIRTLNRDYRGKDKATNVLSFPQDEPEMLGDIIIALETIQREANEQNKSFDNHFTHMLVHGCLHLMGFDHITDDEAEEMETLEVQILKQLNIKNPYEI